MRFDWEHFDNLTGHGLRLIDGEAAIAVPQVISVRQNQGRQEMALISNTADVIMRDVEPTSVTVAFQGGSITLEKPLGTWSRT